ncbi:hypothetical protein ACJJTC_013010 [Scirpophaga incertulas]
MMSTFIELSKKVQAISDMIVSEGLIQEKRREVLSSFDVHMISTKQWFIKISSSNKKKYLLALLADVSSAYTLVILLRTIWNLRPKDAVASTNKVKAWSSYDQPAMDHNRTARPNSALVQVIAEDREWFLTLNPEKQALFLLELLRVSGGPIVWDVLSKAQTIYEGYRQKFLESIQQFELLSEPIVDKTEKTVAPPGKNTNELTSLRRKGSAGSTNDSKRPADFGQHAQKDLEAQLATWNTAIKALRDSVKLDKFEITFKDGTKKKIWKVNRPKSDVIETVDFLQLLPGVIAKYILSFLPRMQLCEYAKVNKYWAYLIDDFKAEMTANQKIHSELDKLKELALHHDPCMTLESIDYIDEVKTYPRKFIRNSAVASFKHMPKDKMCKPIMNLGEIIGKLDRRGAVDENLWVWCQNVVTLKKIDNEVKCRQDEGILQLEKQIFPSPLMKLDLDIPLAQPLFKDPIHMMKRKEEADGVILDNI